MRFSQRGLKPNSEPEIASKRAEGADTIKEG